MKWAGYEDACRYLPQYIPTCVNKLLGDSVYAYLILGRNTIEVYMYSYSSAVKSVLLLWSGWKFTPH